MRSQAVFSEHTIGGRKFVRCRYTAAVAKEYAELVEAFEAQEELPAAAAAVDFQFDLLALLLEDVHTGERPDQRFLVRNLRLHMDEVLVLVGYLADVGGDGATLAKSFEVV